MDKDNRSITERDGCDLAGSIRYDDLHPIACSVINLSVEGAGLLLESEIDELPERFFLSLPIFGDIVDERAVELRWRIGRKAGVRFVHPAAR